MNPGDKALERIIAELTSAIAMTADARLVELRIRAERYRNIRLVMVEQEREEGKSE